MIRRSFLGGVFGGLATLISGCTGWHVRPRQQPPERHAEHKPGDVFTIKVLPAPAYPSSAAKEVEVRLFREGLATALDSKNSYYWFGTLGGDLWFRLIPGPARFLPDYSGEVVDSRGPGQSALFEGQIAPAADFIDARVDSSKVFDFHVNGGRTVFKDTTGPC